MTTDLTSIDSYIAAETESDASKEEFAEICESNRGKYESGVIVGGNLDDEHLQEIQAASNFREGDEECREGGNGERDEIAPGRVSVNEVAETNEDAPQHRVPPLNLICL